MLYYISRLMRRQIPGVAKFGIALEWGSRPLVRIQIVDSDQTMIIRTILSKWVMCWIYHFY